MSHKGFSHVGLSTLDLDKTREFYEGVLGFKAVVADTIKIKEGGSLRHIFFDAGRDQLIAFLEPRGVRAYPQNTMQASTADWVYRPASIILLSRPDQRLPWPINATSFALKESRSRTLSTTQCRSLFISGTPTVCPWSTAASYAISPKMMRKCRSVSRYPLRPWNSGEGRK
jgi:hypothetical protein